MSGRSMVPAAFPPASTVINSLAFPSGREAKLFSPRRGKTNLIFSATEKALSSRFQTPRGSSPVMALYALASGMVEPVFMELMKNKVCLVDLQLSPDVCRNLMNETAAVEVQTGMMQVKTYEALIDAVSCVVFSIFLGSWTDEFGRKIFLFIPFIGYVVAYAYTTAYTYFQMSAYYLLVTPFLYYCTGAMLCFNTALYSFLGDYTTEANRAINVAVIVALRTVSRDAGGVLGGHMLETYGDSAPFYLITLLFLAGFLYVFFFIHDLAPFHSPKRCRCGSALACHRANDGWHAVARPRAGRRRLLLWVMLFCLLLIGICISADISVHQFYLEFGPFFWTLLEFTVFYLVVGVVESVVTVLTVLLLKLKLNMPDAVLGVLAILSAMASLLVYGFDDSPGTVYIAGAVGVFRMLALVAAQSIIMGIAERHEMGKVVTIMIAQLGTAPLFSQLIFSSIFAQTKTYWPGLAWIVGAVILMPVLIGFCAAYVIQKRPIKKEIPASPGNR
ncbi:proton-coupled folate transporter-like [Paramacrobiotus metropolitanus]|uniref:proton-coupled folate transporter-like n=1 Tax=Paramacrobiotus metropolitanus TaxID=2943436 RepID=UPI0024457937|nr:proton-coupled folate transporter-like [Paramacrobiotus metropolitanus]